MALLSLMIKIFNFIEFLDLEEFMSENLLVDSVTCFSLTILAPYHFCNCVGVAKLIFQGNVPVPCKNICSE